MLYVLYQTAADLMLPMRTWATVANQALVAGGQCALRDDESGDAQSPSPILRNQ
jgi:hypothetical protein